MSRDVRGTVTEAEKMPSGEVFLRVWVPAANAADLTPADFLGTATLTLPEGPR